MRKLTSILLAFVMVLSVSMVSFASAASAKTTKAKNVEGTYKVEVIDNNTKYPHDVVEYRPVGVKPTIGVVFYAGNPVDYRDYGTLCKRVASAGYLVISTEFPLDTASLDIQAAEEHMKHYPEIKEWFLMGHSHGGGSAATEASLSPELFKGVILISAQSFPCHLPDNYPVLTFHAEHDLAVPYIEHKLLVAQLYNTDLTDIYIEGANHAQFGDYGVQSNDGKATISKKKQLNITMKHIMKFLNKYQ